MIAQITAPCIQQFRRNSIHPVFSILLCGSTVEQGSQHIGIGFEDIQQDWISVSGVLLRGTEHIILLTVIDHIEGRHGFAGSGGAVCG